MRKIKLDALIFWTGLIIVLASIGSCVENNATDVSHDGIEEKESITSRLLGFDRYSYCSPNFYPHCDREGDCWDCLSPTVIPRDLRKTNGRVPGKEWDGKGWDYDLSDNDRLKVKIATWVGNEVEFVFGLILVVIGVVLYGREADQVAAVDPNDKKDA